MSYRLDIAYPAADYLRELEGRLDDAGFRPMDHDPLNPEKPPARARGWGNFTDGTQRRHLEVWQWMTYWHDDEGRTVWVWLKYEMPENSTAQPRDMRVNLTLFEKGIQNAIRRSIPADP